MIDIIIDLETLGTRPGCPILEIGACAMYTNSGSIYQSFSQTVRQAYTEADVDRIANDPQYYSPSMTGTCKWWLGDRERRLILLQLIGRRDDAKPGLPEWTAMRRYADWHNGLTCGHRPEDVRVWANGPAFDIAILQEALERRGLERPWVCWQERCVRTALECAGHVRGSVPWTEAGPRHRALCDARHEAKKLWLSGALGEASAAIRRLRQRGTVPLTAVNADGSVCIPSEEARP
jgi:hypothetical protein